MQIVVNGREQTWDMPLTVGALLEAMGMTGKRVAVEVNAEIVPRSRHAEHQLCDHDRVEVVVAIGGG